MTSLDGGEAQPSEPDRGPWVSLRRVAAQSAWRAEGAGRSEPSSRPTRRRRSRPVGQPAPEGNDSGGQHRRPACRRRRRSIASTPGRRRVDVGPSHRRRGHRLVRHEILLQSPLHARPRRATAQRIPYLFEPAVMFCGLVAMAVNRSSTLGSVPMWAVHADTAEARPRMSAWAFAIRARACMLA